MQDKMVDFDRRRIRQAGSVFTVLLAGIAMAGALSFVLYQTVSGPMSSMVRVTNKTAAKAQMQSVSSIVIMDAVNQPSNGDCDNDGSVEPRAWRTGTYGPTGGGLLPTTIGAPVTDPWGTDYGYCVWDVGTTRTKCGGTTPNMLTGSDTPTNGNAVSQTVIAIISAGPNRKFETTCNNYVNGTTDLITNNAGSDDIVQRFTYKEAATATSSASLWSLKPLDPTKAIINKDLAVGPTATPTFSVSATTGNATTSGVIQALGITSQGKISSTGGAIQLADSTLVVSCVAGDAGSMSYNTTTKTIQLCNGVTWNPASTQWITTGSDIYFNTGKVGIGTTTPGSKLEVSDSNASAANDVSVFQPSLSNGQNGALVSLGKALSLNNSVGIGFTPSATADSNMLTFSPYGRTTAMVIQAGGNVGIGTASPGNRLTVSAGNSSITSGILQNGATTGYNLMRVMNTGGDAYFGVTDSVGSTGMTGGLAYSTILSSNNATALQLGTGDTARLTILSAGNVGIGTTNPSTFPLQVAGGVGPNVDNTYDLGSAALRWRNIYAAGSVTLPGLTQGSVVFAGAGGIISQDNANFFYDSTNHRLGIGTTGPAYALDVNGTIRAGASALLSTGGAAGYYQDATNGAYRSIVSAATTNGYYFQTNTGAATTMYVGLGGAYNGNVGIGTTTPAAKLDVVGNINSSTGVIAPTLWSSDSIRKLNAASPLYFRNSAGTPEMTLDGSGNLNASGTVTAASSMTAAEVYSNGWFRNNTTALGLYNTATANHWYSDGVYWNTSSAGGGKRRHRHASGLPEHD
jgi:hypothetical protein